MDLMGTSEKYKRLYAYFLEVCVDFLHVSLHGRENVPTTGEEMYDYLEQRLRDIHGKPYDEVINEDRFLTDRQKTYLLPEAENRAIDLENLDIAMYIKISSLLENNNPSRRWRFLNNLRNLLCHLSMEKIRGDIEEFNEMFTWINKSLERHGFKREFLNICRERVFPNPR